MKDNFQIGMNLGIKQFANFKKKGKRWHSRNTPKWILENLSFPYFITQSEETEQLHILQMPTSSSEKVHFILFSIRERITAISNST